MASTLRLLHAMPAYVPHRRQRSAGFTMVEVMAALLIMTVAGQILISTLSAAMTYQVAKGEQGLAMEAATNVIEEMHAVPFYDVFAHFNSVPGDDPDGPGTGHGSSFSVQGLTPVPGDNAVGQVRIPEHAGRLLEGLRVTDLGLPRDLNGDFLVDMEDHSDDYLILPVEVMVRWQGRNGVRSVTVATMLADVEKDEESQ